MGSNTIIAIVVGAILVIVGFALWPVLNGASNSLYYVLPRLVRRRECGTGSEKCTREQQEISHLVVETLISTTYR